MKINAKTRAKLNRSLEGVGTYHATPGMALAAVLEALQSVGAAFGAVFQPKTGRTTNVLTLDGAEVSNALLVVATHEMTVTGRVELTTYVS